jgi:PST family polysaccharide transporter
MPQDQETKVAAGEALATGLVFMMAVTVLQRVIGFARSILFCGMLQDDELGRWSLAFSFLLLAAPLAMLGLPGSFGRYVAYYQQRGQLRTFLRRTLLVCSLLGVIGVAVVVLMAEQWAWLVFGNRELASLIRIMAVTLAIVIISNFMNELLTALRQVRVVSVMQFTSSFMFAVLAVGLLYCTDLREEAVIVAYGLSLLIALVLAIRPLRRLRHESTQDLANLSHVTLWKKLAPFAAWVWITNFLHNMFEVTDRFMIVHLSTTTSAATDSLIGQYHASRIIPFLLVGVSGMVAAVVLPHLSHDWERGERDRVVQQHRLTLKVGALALLLSGTLILLTGPLFFGWLLRDKFEQGMSVLPMTLTYCVWFSLTTLAHNYLWCAERARLGSLCLLVGLAANIAFNALLFPWLGLSGAVMATAIANATALTLVLVFSHRAGFPVDLPIAICCAAPVVLMLGPWVAASSLIALAYLVFERHLLFTADERHEMQVVVDQYLHKLTRWRVARQTNLSAEQSIGS